MAAERGAAIRTIEQSFDWRIDFPRPILKPLPSAETEPNMPGVKPEEDQRSEVPGRRAAALRDAVPLFVTCAAGLICYGLFYNRGLGLSVIGYSIAPAERVMQGEVPYRDFLFNYTPGILWVNAPRSSLSRLRWRGPDINRYSTSIPISI